MLVGLCPAFAADTTSYLWYVEGCGALYLSADGGDSYAELPQLRAEQARTQGDYSVTTHVADLSGGGVRVESRDRWATAVSFRRDYSAAELAGYLSKAVPNPTALLASSGAVDVGVREIKRTGAPVPGNAQDNSPVTERQMRCSTDHGLTWRTADFPAGEEPSSMARCWWAEGAFWLADEGGQSARQRTAAPTYRSVDGASWAAVDPAAADLPGRTRSAADLGGYHFVIDREYSLWVMKGSEGVRGAKLSDDLCKPVWNEDGSQEGIYVDGLTASYDPSGAIRLTVQDGEKLTRTRSETHSVAELEAALAAGSQQIFTPEDPVTENGVTLALAGDGRYLIRSTDGGATWTRAGDPLWSQSLTLLPGTGKAFFVNDGSAYNNYLYTSEDGLAWRAVDALHQPELGTDEWGSANYALAWTGGGYMSCQKVGSAQHGMMGAGGGQVYGPYSSVTFLDENLQVTGAYDFGRQVGAVGCADGTYYATVNDHKYDVREDGTVYAGNFSGQRQEDVYELYSSKDKKTWEKADGRYREIVDSLQPVQGPTAVSGTAKTPLHTVAVLDSYRFVLEPDGEVRLLRDNAQDFAVLPDMKTGAEAKGIVPGSLTAAYASDGLVKLEVADRWDPALRYAIPYPTSSLDWVRDNLFLLGYRGPAGDKVAAGAGVDLGVIDLAAGERELVRRSAETGGKFVWLTDVPWGGHIALLPFTGKAFLVLDQDTGVLYASTDGLAWTSLENSGLAGKDAPEGKLLCDYSAVWAEGKYLVRRRVVREGAGWYAGEDAGVCFTDERFQVLSSHDFGRQVRQVGYFEGLWYADVADGTGLNGEDYDPDGPSTLYSSKDGATWTATDVRQVVDSLRGLGLG